MFRNIVYNMLFGDYGILNSYRSLEGGSEADYERAEYRREPLVFCWKTSIDIQANISSIDRIR